MLGSWQGTAAPTLPCFTIPAHQTQAVFTGKSKPGPDRSWDCSSGVGPHGKGSACPAPPLQPPLEILLDPSQLSEPLAQECPRGHHPGTLTSNLSALRNYISFGVFSLWCFLRQPIKEGRQISLGKSRGCVLKHHLFCLFLLPHPALIINLRHSLSGQGWGTKCQAHSSPHHSQLGVEKSSLNSFPTPITRWVQPLEMGEQRDTESPGLVP